jgi:hypothetical protein
MPPISKNVQTVNGVKYVFFDGKACILKEERG